MAGVLTLVQALAFVDRQVLALLVGPIERDLNINDTQISLLYGLYFALFYAVTALPIAWLADRANRRNIIAGALAFWSLATAACGLAGSYAQLAAARLGVGAGEAGLSPSAQSMLADYFPRERLGAALGVFSTGVSLGGGMALIVGGALLTAAPGIAGALMPWWHDPAPWRVVMLAVGLPGLLVALLFLTVREPVRRTAETHRPLPAVIGYVAKHWTTYLGMIGALSLMIFFSQAASAWIPTFFERRFGWTPQQVGAAYGPIVIVFGGLGALVGGLMAAALKAWRIPRANLWASLGGFLAAAPLGIAFPLAPSAPLALGLIGAMTFCSGLTFGGGYAALQEMTPPRMRAQVTALNGLAVNLIGAGLGPLSVALVTDGLLHNPAQIHIAMTIVSLAGAPLVVAAFLLAMRGHEIASDNVAAMTAGP